LLQNYCNAGLTLLPPSIQSLQGQLIVQSRVRKGWSMTGMAIMAKKKPTTGKPPDDDTDQVRIRVSTAFKAWLQEYADHRQLTLTDTIVQALIKDAKSEGFKVAPKR